MKHHIALPIIALAVCAPALAQTPPPPPPEAAKSEAAPYVAAAGRSDLYEINSSQIARQKTQSRPVRQYADMLIKHHQRTTAATLAAARMAGVAAPAPTLDPDATASIAELQQASAVDFDRLYLGQQVVAHQAALDLHQSYETRGDQAPLRASARKAVPVIRQHLSAAQKMQGGSLAGHKGM